MRFLRLEVQAFGRFQCPFTLELAGRGMVLVEGKNWDAGDAFGSNGAGKSSLFEIIPWVIWGKLPRTGDKRVTDEVVSPTGRASASLWVETRDGLIFRLTRSRDKSGGDFKVEHQVDGQMVASKQAFDTVKASRDINKIIGHDYRTQRTALFLQGAGLDFATQDFSSQQQIVESALSFDLITEAREQASADQAIKEKEFSKIDAEISRLLMVESVHKQTMGTLQRRLAAVNQEDRLALEQEITELEAKYSQEEITNLSTGIATLEGKAMDTRVRAKELSFQEGETRAKQNIAQKVLLAAQSSEPAICPTCRRPMSAPGKKVDEAVLAESTKVFEECQATLVSLKKELQDIEEERAETTKQDQFLRGKLQALRGLVPLISSKKNNLKLMDEQLASIKTEMDQCREELAVVNRAIVDLRPEHHRLKIGVDDAKLWFKEYGADGFKVLMLSKATPHLNDAAGRFSQVLTDNVFGVEFDPLRQKRNQDMLKITRFGQPIAFDLLSSGEKRRTALVISLALRAVARAWMDEKVNIAFYDEAFDHLDQEGVNRVSQVLLHDIEELESVFVVTHNPYLKAAFPTAKVIHVEKAKDIIRVMT